MSQSCTISTCDQPSFAACNCCQQLLCKHHVSEHYKCLSVELSPFIDEINTLDENLKLFNINQATGESRDKLEQWRVECHEKIEELFEKKCQELDQYSNMTDQHIQAVHQLRSRLIQFVCKHETTTRPDIDSLTSNIARLKQDMIHLEQTYIQIRTRPLILTDNMLQITETIRPTMDLFQLSSPCKTIEHSRRSHIILTSSDQFLLIHQPPNLCLINQDVNMIRQVVWPLDKIVDVCWSSTLARFILIDDHDLFLLHENIMRVETIESTQNSVWLSCTCSDTSLFLATNDPISSIFVFNLLPNIELDNQWQYPITVGQHEHIDSIVYNNGTIALLIRNLSDKSLRLELRFASTFDCLWSLPLDITCNRHITFHCCSLSFDEWLVADYQNDRLLHITKFGQIKTVNKYSVAPYRTHLFKQHLLIVLTKHGKNVHRLV